MAPNDEVFKWPSRCSRIASVEARRARIEEEGGEVGETRRRGLRALRNGHLLARGNMAI
jgi:hypothetical protein